MPLHPTWDDITLRLVLTMVAGGIIGFNRGVRGEAAGLRTTILVGLAASVAMIQANILLSVGGRTADSFGMMDLMRLPLGILTGVGFIGAGAILRRGNLAIGVTTAATLWVITVIGLCFGGGQLGLGISATLLGLITLWGLKWVDMRIPREQRALLVINVDLASFSSSDLTNLIRPWGYTAHFQRQESVDAEHARIWFEIGWKRSEVSPPPLDLLKLVQDHYPNSSFEVRPEHRG
jgi:putative Mg2+ transporter-C (MgtC) family protein